MAGIYTIGGGEIIYGVLNAVDLLLNGGSGTLRALITIGAVSGVFVIYYMLVLGNIEYIAKKWAIPLTVMLSFFFVPQTKIWVHDEVSQFHKKLDHVPLGLAKFAGEISTLSKAITAGVEQVFALPDDLKYHKSGIVFGSDIMERAKEFKIVNQNFRENIKNFVGQCVKYDIMLNNKYTFDDLRESTDLWGLVTSNPSKVRGIYWIPIEEGKAEYVTCAGAVEKFNQEWKNELNRVAFSMSKKMFSGRAIGHSTLQSDKLVMTPVLANALKDEFMSNLKSAYSYLGEMADTAAEDILRQNVMINVMNDAASENSRNAGNPISYAEMKALLQQNYTFDTIGRLAAKTLPIMKSVIEALVYACFIFIIPLCMIPTGYRFLINWAATLLWLGFWPPVYAVLNLIMNLAARSSTIAEMGASGGITIANVTGIAAANAEIKVMAGYLALSVPFICIALVKGVGSFIHLASQMTGTTASSAGSAVNEAVNGNFSYGNVNLGNSQMGNVSNLQRNMNSLIGSGGHRLDTGGVQITNDAKGFSVMNRMQDSGPRGIRGVFSRSEAQQEQIRNMNSEQKSMRTAYSNFESAANNQVSQFSERLSNMKAEEISNRVNVRAEEGKSLGESARYVEAHNKGKSFNSGTNAHGTVGLGGAISGSLGLTKTKMGDLGTDKAAEALMGLQASASINGGVGTGVNASNTRIYGSQAQIDEAQTYNYHKSRVESAMKSLGTSERNDELTSIARDYNKNIQEMDSLSKAMEVNQSRIIQAEKNVQESIHTTISLDDNLLDDFIVGAKKANPEMSDNQAKELFFRGDRNSEEYKEAVHYVQAQLIGLLKVS